MIFLTVGTILPFDRLTRAVDEWARQTGQGGQVFGQLGELARDSYRPAAFDWTERLSPVDFRAKIEAAEVIVSHAGIGTIVDALTRAKPIVILARHHALREHVNDHQLETVRKFANRPGVIVAEDDTTVGPALSRALGAPPVDALSPYAQNRLIEAIREAIDV